MLSALFSFLGGSAFRMLWGEVSAYFTRKQEHAQEVERMRLQAEIDAAQHARNLESIKLQADLGVRDIQVRSAAALDSIEATAWAGLVDSTTKLTGLKIIDYWNQSIRPLLATLAIIAVIMQIRAHGWTLGEWDKELIGAILGIFVADRSLAKRGK